MAQFRTTADLVDNVLRRAGELTSGTSPYESDALSYLNLVYTSLLNGGNEFDLDVDEPWVWARARRPVILELQPALETGTVSLTQGLETGSFSAAPAYSVKGWFLRVKNRSEVLRIAQHTAGATAFELDANYPDDTDAALDFTCFKLDYDIVPEFIIIDEENDKLDFEKAASTELTASLTHGTYTPAQLATQVASALTTAASGPTFTCTYNSVTRKFTVTSNGTGPTIFTMRSGTGTNVAVSGWRTLGFDDENNSGALTYTGTYALGGITRLIEPIRVHKSNTFGNIYGLDANGFQRDYAFADIGQGIPDRFAVVRERADGIYTIRMNKYPENKTRIEIEHIPTVRDLKDTVGSVPIIPRRFIHVLEYGATFYLMTDKSDKRAANYANLAKVKLQAMMKQNRKELMRASKDMGRTIPRRDQCLSMPRLQYGYGANE